MYVSMRYVVDTIQVEDVFVEHGEEVGLCGKVFVGDIIRRHGKTYTIKERGFLRPSCCFWGYARGFKTEETGDEIVYPGKVVSCHRCYYTQVNFKRSHRLFYERRGV